jgi:D-arabinose 1-dehydrogenase-like Zn-dependent alcohol dehydrogenase
MTRFTETPQKLISCLGREQYCAGGMTGTYGGKFSRQEEAKGQKSYGGYANFWRGPSRFTVAIPEGLDPAVAAPMMCGGATLFSPLTQYGAGTTAKDVGIVGIGMSTRTLRVISPY